MKSQILVVLMISLALLSCDFRKSKNKDIAISKDLTTGKNPTTGMITKPEGLSCDEVWLSIDEEKTDRRTFIYGEAFYLNFNNLEGFNKVDEAVFPGMFLKVTDEGEDTIMQTEDMYADSINGIILSPQSIKIHLDIVKPIRSNQKYTLFIKIWDKLGDGIFVVETPFNVIENERISIEKNYISYDEIYLISFDKNKVITDGNIDFNENVYLVFEGLSGFFEVNGKIFPGSKFQVTDNSNTPIMNYNDLFYMYTTTGLSVAALKEKIYLKMMFIEGKVDNPIHCEATIFDKRRIVANIKVKTDLNIKNSSAL